MVTISLFSVEPYFGGVNIFLSMCLSEKRYTIWLALKKLKIFDSDGIHLLLSDKIWQQDLDTEDYNQVSKWPENIITEGPYLKLSIKHPIEEIDTLFEKATYYYGLILSCLNQE